jgi:hypothetical protein
MARESMFVTTPDPSILQEMRTEPQSHPAAMTMGRMLRKNGAWSVTKRKTQAEALKEVQVGTGAAAQW